MSLWSTYDTVFLMFLLGYGEGTTYDNAASCRWYLQVPAGFLVNLTFDQFYVEYSGPECIYDYVEVLDGRFK